MRFTLAAVILFSSNASGMKTSNKSVIEKNDDLIKSDSSGGMESYFSGSGDIDLLSDLVVTVTIFDDWNNTDLILFQKYVE